MITVVAIILVVAVFAVLVASGIFSFGPENYCPTGETCGGGNGPPPIFFSIKTYGIATNPCVGSPTSTIAISTAKGGAPPLRISLDFLAAEMTLSIDSLLVTYPSGRTYSLPSDKTPAPFKLHLGGCDLSGGGQGAWDLTSWWSGTAGHYIATVKVRMQQVGCLIGCAPVILGASANFDM